MIEERLQPVGGVTRCSLAPHALNSTAVCCFAGAGSDACRCTPRDQGFILCRSMTRTSVHSVQLREMQGLPWS